MTPTDTKAFLKEIYKNCTEGYITIVTLPEREIYWFKVKDINTAAMKAVKCGKRTNTYFGIALRKEMLPNNARGGEHDVIIVPALYADIDVKGKAHAKEELPETKEQAIEFLNSLPVKPSISVWSGNGIHAYWLLDKPFKISNDEDRERISGLVSGWGTYINKMGTEKNWKIDNVYDLARVLRVPGTVNHKLADGEMCSVIENTGERYDISVFEPYRMVQPPAEKHEEAVDAPVGNADRIIEKCGFIRHCRDNAATLSEPSWHAMVTNVSLARDGPEVVHTLSQPYPGYNVAETDEKIKRAIKENKPHTCRFIREKLGFKCQDKCKVKAPVVYAVLTKEERIQKLVSEDITDIAKALSDEVLELMAYAKDRMPSEYAKFKLKLKNKMSLRDFEKAVNHKAQSYAANLSNKRNKPVLLEGLDLKGIVQPSGWEISIKTGVKKYAKVMDAVFVTTVCPSALVISKRLENLDDDTEKVEVKFYRNGRWKAFLAPRSQVFSKNLLMKYADSGLPVSSKSSEELVLYLWDFENVNLPVIPLVKSISRVGWTGNDFFPYATSKEIIFETEFREANDIVRNMKKKGSYVQWKENVKLARQNPLARFLISASFASPLLELLNHRVFFIHIWHDSKSGKTAVIKLGVSVWGNPNKLMGSFNATSVGLERMAGTLKHLPFAIDELQVLNEKRLSTENIIYGLSNGFGRIRGAKDGGVQDLVTWRNIVITSGEQPMSKDASNDGVMTRVMELYGRPVEDVSFAQSLHLLSENNYGHAGEEYIRYIINESIIEESRIRGDYNAMLKDIDGRFRKSMNIIPGSHLDNIAVVCLGDFYSSISIFNETREDAWAGAVNLGVSILNNNKQLEEMDTITRAWEFVNGWVIENMSRFENAATPCYGTIEGNKHYIIPSVLREALEANNYDYKKITRGFKDRGYFETMSDSNGISRMHIQKRINGINCKVFSIELDTDIEEVKPLVKETV